MLWASSPTTATLSCVGGEQPHDVRLQVIGVLIFVDHDDSGKICEKPVAHVLVIGEQILQLGQADRS